MDTKIALYAVVMFAAIFAIAAPVGNAAAETLEIETHGEGGDHEGKSCPFKERKSASVIVVPLI